jgi:hypothetical protein
VDPNIALDKLREMCAESLDDGGNDRAGDIATQFEALDQWLSNGGFLPSEWHRETDKLRGVP